MTITPTSSIGSLAADASPTALITGLKDDDHITFIRTYQDRFDTYRLTPPALKYGAQKRWVRKNIMGEFQRKFGSVSKGFVDVSIFNDFLTSSN